jgi:hypothetical protein
MKRDRRHGRLAWALAGVAVVAAGVAAPGVAAAGPASTIYSPIVDYREWELELKGGIQDWNQPDGERAGKLALGYGLMRRWGVEVEAEYSQSPGRAGHVEEYEFENIFQLTEHGEHWLDAGIFAEFEHNRLEHFNRLVLGPMFQRETLHTQTNVNIYWERRLTALPTDTDAGGDAPESRNGLQYQVQWKYNLGPRFQPGFQAFGSLGDPAHLRSEELKVGPAFFGAANLGNAKGLRYNAALLAGLTQGSPDLTLRFQLEYEFF